MPLAQERRRAAALQDASRSRSMAEVPTGFGVRQPFGALGLEITIKIKIRSTQKSEMRTLFFGEIQTDPLTSS